MRIGIASNLFVLALVPTSTATLPSGVSDSLPNIRPCTYQQMLFGSRDSHEAYVELEECAGLPGRGSLSSEMKCVLHTLSSHER